MPASVDPAPRALARTRATTSLIALNAIAFAAALALGMDPLAPDGRQLLALGGNFLPLTRFEPWRLLSALFLHAGALHLVFNMWALHDLGRIAERLFGTARFVLIYLLGGLLGSLTSLFFSASEAVAVGASGAVFAAAGAILAAATSRSMPRSLATQLRRAILILVGYALMLGIVLPDIDNAAHIGGLCAGYLIGRTLIALPASGSHPTLRWRGVLIAVLATAALAGVGLRLLSGAGALVS
ncbi:MAG: rhomboid family intramembrane serine protease [Burkholderiaceae bacterium]